MRNEIHNEGLHLINLLLTNGYSVDTLPLPKGKLWAIEERDEKLNKQEVAKLRLAYANSLHAA